MYITEDMVLRAAARYGSPAMATFCVECSGHDFDYIRSTQKHNRAHDVTLYVVKGDRIVVNAKHFYPPGLYRAPSGGLEPAESFEEGIARELLEEVGCHAEIERFILISRVDFVRGGTGRLIPAESVDTQRERIAWTTYVFQLHYVDGDFEFTDKREIRQVSLARLSDFAGYSEIMRRTSRGGFHYRAALHEAVAPLLCL